MVSLLLLRQIAQMFVYALMGWALVRTKVIRSEDSRILSLVALYLVTPCSILSAFQQECTPEVIHNLALSGAAAVALHVLVFLLGLLARRVLHLSPVEEASVIYSNAGNLVFPLVAAIFGKEWVIYSCTFNMVQIVLIWTHGRMLISGERHISPKKILLHVNILSAFAGAALFFLQLPLPGVVTDSIDAVGSMIGPVCMMVTGMLMAGMDLRRLFRMPGVWRVSFLRLAVIPLVLVLAVKYSGLARLTPDGETILLISLLGAITPTASTVTQQTQVYRPAAATTAGAINVVTTLLCIVSMPLMIALYQLP